MLKFGLVAIGGYLLILGPIASDIPYLNQVLGLVLIVSGLAIGHFLRNR